jgi:hypothetical protein
LWTRSISPASFDGAGLLGAGAEGEVLDDRAASGVADCATAGIGRSVRAGPVGGRGLAIKPASATPAASVATNANGARVKSVPRLIARIFIEAIDPAASNDAQRRTQTKPAFDD